MRYGFLTGVHCSLISPTIHGYAMCRMPYWWRFNASLGTDGTHSGRLVIERRLATCLSVTDFQKIVGKVWAHSDPQFPLPELLLEGRLEVKHIDEIPS